MHKNEESSGLSYGYGLSLPQQKTPLQDFYAKGYVNKNLPKSEPAYMPTSKLMDYKSEQIRDGNNYNSKLRDEANQNDEKFSQGYKNTSKNDELKYDAPKYADAYTDPKYQKYDEAKYQKYDEAKYQKYDEAKYQKYDEANYPKYEEPKYQKYEEPKYENPYSQNPRYESPYLQKYDNPPNPKYENPNEPDAYAKYSENYYQKNIEKGNPENPYEKGENPQSYSPQDGDPQEDYLEGKNDEGNYPVYSDEIDKLKEELKRKEEELNFYQQSLNSKNPSNDPDSGLYDRINKSLFDKQRLEEQKKMNSMSLDYQISQKSRAKTIEQLEKEKEQAIRLEMLKKLKEDEARERYEKIRKAKEYREQLEVQSLVKSNLNYQEKILSKNENFVNNESPLRNSENNPNNNVSVQNFSYSPGIQKFTKKTPKTMSFNPITGVLRDTSQYVLGQYPPFNAKDPAGVYKNQNHVSELAGHPAFQQLKYTKNHPKVVPSYPVTGNAGVNFVEAKETDYIKQDEDRPRPSDKHLAEYGNLMMQNRNPNYS